MSDMIPIFMKEIHNRKSEAVGLRLLSSSWKVALPNIPMVVERTEVRCSYPSGNMMIRMLAHKDVHDCSCRD